MNVQQIYLMGMKHTGKSQHGRVLADRLGWQFLDTDTIVQELDAADSGMRRPVRDIYREDGPDRFRQLELAAVRLIAEQTTEAVVATGGGLCDNAEAIAALGNGLRVHLYDTLESISERVFRNGIPAFLHTDDETAARDRFAELYHHRVPCYEKIADLRIDLSNRSLEDAQRVVVSTIEEYLHGGK